jgi:tetratricopeptide (TPR) repeat protein
MPRRAASDVPHTAITDHRILRRPASGAPGKVVDLEPWREPAPALARRNQGLACISVGEREQNASLLNEGLRLLADLGTEASRDADVLTAIGLVLLRKSRPPEASRLFDRAARIEPVARNFLNLGVAQDQAGQTSEAVRSLERAIDLDPSLDRAYGMLAQMHNRRGQPQLRREVLERYLRFNPQSLAARQALQQPSPRR